MTVAYKVFPVKPYLKPRLASSRPFGAGILPEPRPVSDDPCSGEWPWGQPWDCSIEAMTARNESNARAIARQEARQDVKMARWVADREADRARSLAHGAKVQAALLASHVKPSPYTASDLAWAAAELSDGGLPIGAFDPFAVECQTVSEMDYQCAEYELTERYEIWG